MSDYSVTYVGREKTPVIVFDDFFWSADELKQVAPEEKAFAAAPAGGYPGVRAPLPPLYIKSVLETLEPIMRNVYGFSPGISESGHYGLYSLVSTPERYLSKLQRVPHFDTKLDHYYAVLHYLSDGEHGGTGFFRHIPTGFERINASRYPLFVEAAKRHMDQFGVPESKYVKETNDHFELIHSIPYKQGRMLLYPGNLLHSGLINPSADINSDPTSGRLTANIFINFQ
ncbi:DUF6445 family protein [Gilvimarinus agarilyticus]|uniref:DUF6445 family protein n=1 Tax=Gilvimarinus agarilyticus TaxID=679259 RepID=UPI0005A27D81|nr:DUF6445 family protein [Gilvimarinus agarilyticus]